MKALRTNQTSIKAWPILGSTAAQGIVGMIAKLAVPHSEADPVAVMATPLAWGAAIFGRNRFYRVGDTCPPRASLLCPGRGFIAGAEGHQPQPSAADFSRSPEASCRAKSTLPFPVRATAQRSRMAYLVVKGLDR